MNIFFTFSYFHWLIFAIFLVKYHNGNILFRLHHFSQKDSRISNFATLPIFQLDSFRWIFTRLTFSISFSIVLRTPKYSKKRNPLQSQKSFQPCVCFELQKASTSHVKAIIWKELPPYSVPYLSMRKLNLSRQITRQKFPSKLGHTALAFN